MSLFGDKLYFLFDSRFRILIAKLTDVKAGKRELHFVTEKNNAENNLNDGLGVGLGGIFSLN
jgi:hypothetical protein